MTSVFRISILLTTFFGINKVVALLRQTLIASYFGFSPEIDAFNVANNLPDMIFSLFSGGALALAFIPVFVEYIEEHGKAHSWKLFSKTANFLFLVTLGLCIIVAIFARPIVTSQFGISPGFSASQQDLVVSLMRINLIAILIFSLSGLVMASLQAHKHFLLPAISPILYNAGLIFGVVVLAPKFGIYGLALGTIIGALLHLGIQTPGIIHHQFRWHPLVDFNDPGFRKILKLMIPRILTVLLINITFLSRDNLASRLPIGSVTALTYGYFIMQVPETLIGTAIATAILPSLSELISKQKRAEFATMINHAIKVLIVTTIGISVLISLTLPIFIGSLFDFGAENISLLTWTTRGFMLGLLGQCLLEVVVRAFYAQKNATLPLLATAARTIVFLILAVITFRSYGATGIAVVDSISVTIEVAILLYFLAKFKNKILQFGDTLIRTAIGGLVSGALVLVIIKLSPPTLLATIIAILIGGGVYLLFIAKDLKLLYKG